MGKAMEERTVSGTVERGGRTTNYCGGVNLCSVCAELFDRDIHFRLEASAQAVQHIIGVI